MFIICECDFYLIWKIQALHVSCLVVAALTVRRGYYILRKNPRINHSSGYGIIVVIVGYVF